MSHRATVTILVGLAAANACTVAPAGYRDPPPHAPVGAPPLSRPAAPASALSLSERQQQLEALVAAADARRAPHAEVATGDLVGDLVTCRRLCTAGDEARAAAAFAAVAVAYPDDALVAFEVARFEIASGAVARAIPTLDGLQAAGAIHPELGWLRGRAHLEAGDASLGVALLREELATGRHFADAAARLVAHFTATEQYREAQAVLAAARERAPERVDLALLDAGVRFDVWDLDGARGVLAAVVAHDPNLGAAWLELADVERARRDVGACREALAKVASDAAFAGAARARLREIEDLCAADRPTATARDMFAMLRGEPKLNVRLARFEQLLGDPATSDRAIEIALLQDEPVLRVVALRVFPADAMGFADALTAGLEDPDPRVRGAAARRLADLDDAVRAVGLARAHLDAEEDPYAFRALHDALSRWLGPQVDFPVGGANDPSTRSTIRQAWRLL